jgi:hypothetical protein
VRKSLYGDSRSLSLSLCVCVCEYLYIHIILCQAIGCNKVTVLVDHDTRTFRQKVTSIGGERANSGNVWIGIVGRKMRLSNRGVAGIGIERHPIRTGNQFVIVGGQASGNQVIDLNRANTTSIRAMQSD